MAKPNPYKNFDRYVLRAPLFSVDFFKRVTSSEEISDNDYMSICKNNVIRESIYLASPSLLSEIDKWLTDELTDKKEITKLKDSILKYFSRMCSRCTPFALFAGCSVGKFNDETKIELKGNNSNLRHSRLDMNLLVAISQEIARLEHVKQQLHFFPNSSIYRVGDKFRYINYRYINGSRNHQIVEVDHSDYLAKILEKSESGQFLNELANSISHSDISLEEKKDFINELVENRLLVSELEPSVSGPEFLDQIEATLMRLNGVNDLLLVIREIRLLLMQIDKKVGSQLDIYKNLSETVKKLNVIFDLKYLVQTDMVLGSNCNSIGKNILPRISKGILLLNRISPSPSSSTQSLTQFSEAFFDRYEEREVSLAKVLDTEMGIGYLRNADNGDINPLVDGLAIQKKQIKNQNFDIKWNSISSIFQQKLIDAYKKNEYVVVLKESDFQSLEESWDDLPDTMSIMMEFVLIDGKRKLKFSGSGGSSAANLLSRFSYGDAEIDLHVKEIALKERFINQDKILAEIVHLPESRAGNILMRPILHEYEIPYLANSLVEKEKQIPLEDIFISSRGKNNIVLKSRRLGKEIVPRLTNAHNYSQNSLPIYHFLADMQLKGKRTGINISWGPFAGEFGYLPRIEFEDLILHDATWNIKKTEINSMLKANGDNALLKQAVNVFREQKRMPKMSLLADGDNELLINFDNLSSVRMLLRIVKNRTSFKLTEFLFEEDGVVKDSIGEYYTNQVIVSFYNDKKTSKIDPTL
jgi:hypothetical protein